jgi:predicted metal-binding membrane protein
VLIAGCLQFTQWKLRHLACCRPAPVRTVNDDAAAAYRYGVRLGLHCAKCCGGQIAILLVVGVMDLVAMAVVAAAITVERLLPAGERVARVMGIVIIATGILLIAHAA